MQQNFYGSDIIMKDEEKREETIDGAVDAKNGKYPIHCLTIIGQIEGHYESNNRAKTTKYEHVIPRLIDVEENPDIKGLLIILNTVGGDVEAGLAISELIRGLTKPTASLVLGGRTFHRHTFGGFSESLIYSAYRHHDGASGKTQRHGAWGGTDNGLPLGNTGQDNFICV